MNYVEIANAAAITVGTSARLTDPGDDTTLGRAVSAVWDLERLAALRDGAWNFAMRRASLPRLAGDAHLNWSARFGLPSECLRLIEVYDIPGDRWQLEGRAIHADMTGPLRVRYLADIVEPAEFDPAFAKAFALRLACAIGNRIAGSAFKEELNWQKYRKALAEAKNSDAMENPPIDQAESAWITSRWTGGATDLTRVDGGWW